ncbi:hypothetical protein MHIP_46980 [Mycolicibacterium hippocampi]|uniref:Uncharacterized protein n=1 Tax=Mycolicibacterium hippocampi TaxID=659824 RepID=A0A7I9ZT69_9MYCO|nr:hypothetical protein MHIP_46980 [Mycolicibacterium hippocampi]
MSSTESQRSVRVRWIWIASTAAATVAAVLAAMWLIPEPASPQRKADCAVVEGTARQWQAAAETLTPAQGATLPSDPQTVVEQYTQMAMMVHTAADSVSTPEIKQHLTEWADAADRLAMSERVDSGGPEQSETLEEMLEIATPMNDAAGALGELCPNMPAA